MARAFAWQVAITVAALLFCTEGWGRNNEVFYEQRLDPYPVPILIPTKFGGQVYPFLLDTGSSRNLCDVSLRASLGPPLGTVRAATPGGVVKVAFYEPPEIFVGRGRLPAMPVGVEDFSDLRKVTGFNIRGILGAQALQGLAIWLDYDRRSLKLVKNVKPKGMHSIDLEYGADRVSPYVTVDVAGQKLRFCIDLGFNGTVGLSREAFAKLTAAGIVKEFKGQEETSITMKGKMKNRSGYLVKGELLGRKLVGISIGRKGDFNMLGMEFLVNYNVIIDLERSKFYYQPRKTPAPVNVFGMMGVVLFCEEGYGVVYQLRPGAGPAAEAGLREGDKLLRLGNIRRGEFNSTRLYELGLRSAGETIEVELLRRGHPQPILTRMKMGR